MERIVNNGGGRKAAIVEGGMTHDTPPSNNPLIGGIGDKDVVPVPKGVKVIDESRLHESPQA